MHSLKILVRARRSLHKLGAFPHRRSFSALPHYASSDDLQDQVLVDGRANSRTAILNRPSAVNSLTTSMVARLKRLYESWEENPNIGFVLMKNLNRRRNGFTFQAFLLLLSGGSGKAFCSGGDVVTLYHLLTEGNIEECKIFFDALYKFLFSHPEVQIGFHPDAGASFHLSRLPGYVGEHLALTGDKLNGVEMVACRLATHYSLNARLALIEERLGRLTTDDPSVIETSLSQYGGLVYPDRKSIIHKVEVIDKCFSHDTVEEIIHVLDIEAAESYDEWCAMTLKKLREASPLSLKVTLRSIREGRFQTLDQCLTQEYRISLRGISGEVSKDFCKECKSWTATAIGVWARLVDKNFAPKWDPPSLDEVTNEMVDFYVSPLLSEPELELRTALREPSVCRMYGC
ncbi:hypothetical protein BT93_H2672 [Corymbia citriodora subsp. variegata]|nr:hypothetical protein BT93_H2672 [Corymbia citriodora subsp. variegata]